MIINFSWRVDGRRAIVAGTPFQLTHMQKMYIPSSDKYPQDESLNGWLHEFQNQIVYGSEAFLQDRIKYSETLELPFDLYPMDVEVGEVFSVGYFIREEGNGNILILDNKQQLQTLEFDFLTQTWT